MICNKCKEEIVDSDRFCSHCGNKNIKYKNNRKNYKILIFILIIIAFGTGITLAYYYDRFNVQTMSNDVTTPEEVEIKVPNFKSLSIDSAKKLLEDNKLLLGTITEEYDENSLEGEIIGQQPVEGTSIKSGSKIDLVVSKGRKEKNELPSEEVNEKVEVAPKKQNNARVASSTYNSLKKAELEKEEKYKFFSDESGVEYTIGDIKYSEGMNMSFVYLYFTNVGERCVTTFIDINFYDENNKLIGKGEGVSNVLEPGKYCTNDIVIKADIKNFDYFSISEHIEDHSEMYKTKKYLEATYLPK